MTVIRSFADLTISTEPVEPTLKVCVVSSEFSGSLRNGGIGTATSGLVEHLVDSGHRVTFLYTQVANGQPLCQEESWDFWVEAMARRGITLSCIPHRGHWNDWRHKSWLVKEFLEKTDFDAVYFNEHHGSGYYALAAKRARLRPFSNQVYCVITHGSLEWVANINDQPIQTVKDIEMMGLERRSVEWADVVIGPSRYLLEEYERYGWSLPANTFNQPYALRATSVEEGKSREGIDEIVFFGRLETRKGLWLFCDAIESMKDQLKDKTVTFMGRMTSVSGIPSGLFIANRAANWPFSARIISRFGQPEALRYLMRRNCLAVMPSLADNSPCVVYECLHLGIPFVATSKSGAAELIHDECREHVLVEPEVGSLAEKLREILRDGARPGRASFDDGANLQAWRRWHCWLQQNRGPFVKSTSPPSKSTIQNTEKLVFFLDDGVGPISLIIDNIARSVRRFDSTNTTLLLLSSRSRQFCSVLQTLIEATHQGFLLYSMDDLPQVRQALRAADVVFVAGISDEILPTFYQQALESLTSSHVDAVCCAVAERTSNDSSSTLTEVPIGDAPVMASLGFPRGMGVYAIDVSSLSSEIEELELLEPDGGTIVSQYAFGEALVRRIVRNGGKFQLVPRVGAVRDEWHSKVCLGLGSYLSSRQIMSGLEFGQHRDLEAAASLAVSADGSRNVSLGEARFAHLVETTPLDHSPQGIETSGDPIDDMSTFASSLGRLDEALQIASSTASFDAARIQELESVAKTAFRRRGVGKLVERLTADVIATFRTSDGPNAGLAGNAGSLKEDGRRSRLLAMRRAIETGASSGEAVNANLAKQLVRYPAVEKASGQVARLTDGIFLRGYENPTVISVDNQGVSLKSNAAGEPPVALIFVDVPLLGYTSLNAQVRLSTKACAAVFRLRVFDQTVGTEIGSGECELTDAGLQLIQVPLHGLYLFASFVCELEPSDCSRAGTIARGLWERIELR